MHRILQRARSSGVNPSSKKKKSKRDKDEDLSASAQKEPKSPPDEVNNNQTEESTGKEKKTKGSTASKSKKDKKKDKDSKNKLKKTKKDSDTEAVRKVVSNVLYEEVTLKGPPTKAQTSPCGDDNVSVSSQLHAKSMTSQNELEIPTVPSDRRSMTSQNDIKSLTSGNEDTESISSQANDDTKSISSQIYDEIARDDFIEEDIYEEPDRRSPMHRPLPEPPQPRTVSQSSGKSHSRQSSSAGILPLSPGHLSACIDEACGTAERRVSASTSSVGSHRSRTTTGDSVFHKGTTGNSDTASLASRKSADEDTYETADVNFLTRRARAGVLSVYDDNLNFRTYDISSTDSPKSRYLADEDLYETTDLTLLAAKQRPQQQDTNRENMSSSTTPQARNSTDEDLYETTDLVLIAARARSQQLETPQCPNAETPSQPTNETLDDEDVYETTDLAVISARLRSGAVMVPSDEEGDIYSHLSSQDQGSAEGDGQYDTFNRELEGAPVEVIYESYSNDTNVLENKHNADHCYDDVSFCDRLANTSTALAKSDSHLPGKLVDIMRSPDERNDTNDSDAASVQHEGSHKSDTTHSTSRDSEEGDGKTVSSESISGNSACSSEGNVTQPDKNEDLKSSPSSNQRAKSEYHSREKGQDVKPRAQTTLGTGDEKPAKPTIFSRIKGAHRKKPAAPGKPKPGTVKIPKGGSAEYKQRSPKRLSPRIVSEKELAKSPLYQSAQQKLNPANEETQPR